MAVRRRHSPPVAAVAFREAASDCARPRSLGGSVMADRSGSSGALSSTLGRHAAIDEEARRRNIGDANREAAKRFDAARRERLAAAARERIMGMQRLENS